MFESGGIGAQIDKKVGALTGNPQAMQQLQQKQKTQQGKGVTPDLLDALALQKVMSDKALAKQQLALSQQQDAGTVVEQMEQKLVGMNKEELTAQTAGILGERNKKRQQQVSSGKPPQQQGQRPPMQMAKGAPQGLPAAPRPPTQFAAQGGIIGYAAGGITDIDVENWLKDNPNVFPQGSDAVRRKAAMKALTQEATSERRNAPVSTQERAEFKKNNPTVFPKAEDSVIDKIIQEERFGTRTLSPEPVAKVGTGGLSNAQSSALQGAMEIGGADLGAGVSGIAAEAKKKQAAMEAQNQPSGVLKPGGIPSVPDMGGAGVLKPPAVQPPAGQPPAGGLEVPSAAVPAGATTDPLKEALGAANVLEDQLTSASLRGEDFPANTSKTQATDAFGPESMGIMKNMRDSKPKESLVNQEKLGDVRYNRDAKRIAEEELIAEKRALDDKQLDPESVARERVNAGLAGLIQGGTSRGASVARSKFDANVSKRQRDAINETIKLTRDKDKSDDDRLKAIDVTAGKVFERESADRVAALQGLVGLSSEDVKQINNQAKIEFEANKFGIQSKLTALSTKAKQDLNRLIQQNANVTQYAALLKQVQAGQVAALDAMYETIAAEMKQAETNVIAGTASPEEIKMVRDKQIKYMAILDMAGMHDLIEQLRAAAVKGTGGNTPTPTTADPLEDAMNKYN
jgi:hypothetical protein